LIECAESESFKLDLTCWWCDKWRSVGCRTFGCSGYLAYAKFFHMFLTMEEERPYLGMQHPLTGEWYWYATLPMGSTNLPGIAGHFGAAFLQTVTENDPCFQGTPMMNDLILS
jgi:hypothetical protein